MLLARLAVPLLLLAAPVARATCPPPGHSVASLRALRASSFAVRDDVQRQALALALTDCLGNPDPALRERLLPGVRAALRALP